MVLYVLSIVQVQKYSLILVPRCICKCPAKMMDVGCVIVAMVVSSVVLLFGDETSPSLSRPCTSLQPKLLLVLAGDVGKREIPIRYPNSTFPCISSPSCNPHTYSPTETSSTQSSSFPLPPSLPVHYSNSVHGTRG
jgi:hypothetical protein